MSHPGEISCRCSLRISRSRRRMRLRRTALPSAFLMLQPNRLRSSPLGRTKIVNSRLERRRPSRYTASYSARRATRHSRGRPPAATSDSREAVASFFAALRKDFPSTLTLHAFAEAVFLVTAAHMGLKRTFRQRILSSIFAVWPALAAELAHRMPLADPSEFPSVCDRRSTVKEAYGISELAAGAHLQSVLDELRTRHSPAVGRYFGAEGMFNAAQENAPEKTISASEPDSKGSAPFLG